MQTAAYTVYQGPCDSGNVLVQFIAGIGFGCLICTFKVVVAGRTTTVLRLDFVVFYKIKLQLHFVELSLIATILFSHSVISFLSK